MSSRFLGLVSLVMAASAAYAGEPLVPEGEPAASFEAARWAPARPFVDVAAAGGWTAAGSVDGTLRVWNARGREERRLSLGAPVVITAASADGRFVAAGLRTGAIVVIELATGKEQLRSELAGLPTVLALSPDGSRVLAVAGDAPAQLLSSAPAIDYPGAQGLVRAGTFLADGAALAAFADRTLKLLPATGEPKALGPVDGEITRVAAGSGLVAVGTESGGVALFDAASGQARGTLQAHPDAVSGLEIVAGGRMLLVSSSTGGAHLFDVATRREVRALKSEGACCSAATVASGGRTVVAVAGDRLLRWDAATGEALAPLGGNVSIVGSLALSADGTVVVTGGSDGVVRVVDPATGRETRRLGTLRGAASVAIDPTGKTVAAGDVDGTVRAWELATGRELRRVREHRGAVLALAFLPDGSAFVSASADHTARLTTLAVGAPSKMIAELPGAALAVAVSKDGASVAVAGEGGVRAWSVAKAEGRKLLAEGSVSSVAVSEDGKRIVAGFSDGTARVLDAVTGAEQKRLKAGESAAAAATDGKLFAAGAGPAVVLFDGAAVESGRLTLGADASALAIAAAGGSLAVADRSGAVSVFALPARTLVSLFRYGPNGSFARIGDKVVRDDDGRFVQLAEPDGALKSHPPAVDGASTRLTAEPAGVVLATDEVPGQLKFKLATDAAAFWVGLEPVEVPAGLTLLVPPVLARLAPGAPAEFVVRYAVIPGTSAPRDLALAFELSAAGVAPTKVTAALHTPGPVIEVGKSSVEGSGAATVAKVELVNSGDGPSGPLSLVSRFMADGVEIDRARQQIDSLPVGEHRFVLLAVPAEAMAKKASLELAISTVGASPQSWSAPVPLHRRTNWLPLVMGVLALLGVAALVWFVRISRHPIVLQVTKSPTDLLHYDIGQYELVHAALTRGRRLDSALAAARISKKNWDRLRAASGPSITVASAVAEAFGAKLLAPLAGGSAYGLEMPPLALRFPQKTAVAIITGSTLEPGTAAAIGGDIHAGGQGPSVAIAIDLTSTQQAAAVLQSVPRMSFVVIGRNLLRDMMLSDDPIELLQHAIAEQRPRAELSPYVMSGGIEEEALFFGRDRELRQITDRVLHNFIVVAPRQMGKSSLLKAVFRRLSARPDVEVHHIALFEEDLVARVARQLGVKKPETIDDFIEIAAGSRRKPRVWLIDEADSFIVKDSKGRYPLAQAMRTLSEEGRAYFVLAGFWHLYAAAFMNPNNPLRNFGEIIRLEPLDREAARDLATKPMEALGLAYESPALVDKLLDETACRAHLIAGVCRGVLEGLGPEDKVILAAAVDAALYENPALSDEFKHWRRDVLGRAAIRAALLGEAPSRAELRERLVGLGFAVPDELLSATLSRLELGYLLVPDAGGLLRCPVPLLQRFILNEEDLEAGLRRDAEEFLASHAAA